MVMSDSHRQELLKSLPPIDVLLSHPRVAALIQEYARAAVVDAARSAVETVRRAILNGRRTTAPEIDELAADIQGRLAVSQRPSLRRVINATGIIVHTGLGRSLLASEAVEALAEATRSHSNLETDLQSGERGHRDTHVSGLLCRLTGAESATVVNNNAAAVLLTLNTLAEGREVILSRGQMIEIGGSFRLPEVIAKSGCRLVGVGTTNKTHVRDYEEAITEQTGVILRAHPSNYGIVGFSAQASLAEIVEVAHKHGIPVVDDLGSGALVDLSSYGVGREPLVQASVRVGADVVTFSGDKMLGGPQAGIILGRQELVERIRRNPLARAVRVGKLTISALEATLRLYLDELQAVRAIPTLAAAVEPLSDVKRRAGRLRRALRRSLGDLAEVSSEESCSRVGGGALPMNDLPTQVVTVRPLRLSTEEFARRLRLSQPAVVGRVQRDALLLDPRTLRDEEIREVAQVAARALLE